MRLVELHDLLSLPNLSLPAHDKSMSARSAPMIKYGGRKKQKDPTSQLEIDHSERKSSEKEDVRGDEHLPDTLPRKKRRLQQTVLEKVSGTAKQNTSNYFNFFYHLRFTFE